MDTYARTMFGGGTAADSGGWKAEELMWRRGLRMIADIATCRSSISEELANTVTHGIGLVVAIGAMVVLVVLAAIFGGVWHIVGCSIYGGTLVFLYAASTLYHIVRRPATKSILKTLDHSAIFLLIAGTYTPFTLVNLRGVWGWSLLGVIWVLALAGIIWEGALRRRSAAGSLVLYVAMGWVALVAVKPIISAVATHGVLLILAGGVAYTAGIAFYVWRRIPYHHAIWHLFVILGSTFHYFAVLLYVVPLA